MKTLLFAISLLCFSHFAHAQKSDEDRILLLLSQQVDGWNRGSMEDYMKGYWEHDSLLFVGKNGPTRGYDSTLLRYTKAYPDEETMGKLSSTILELKRIAPDAFFVLGRWELSRKKGNVSGYYTLLLRKINREWVIVADHSS